MLSTIQLRTLILWILSLIGYNISLFRHLECSGECTFKQDLNNSCMEVTKTPKQTTKYLTLLCDDLYGSVLDYLDFNSSLQLSCCSKSMRKFYIEHAQQRIKYAFWNRYLGDDLCLLEKASTLILYKKLVVELQLTNIDFVFASPISFVEFCNVLVEWYAKKDLTKLEKLLNALLASGLISLRQLYLNNNFSWPVLLHVACHHGMYDLALSAFYIMMEKKHFDYHLFLRTLLRLFRARNDRKSAKVVCRLLIHTQYRSYKWVDTSYSDELQSTLHEMGFHEIYLTG